MARVCSMTLWILIATGGLVLSACDSTTSGPNRRPLADAGPDQVVRLDVGSVILDGSGSEDPDGDSLTHGWELLSRPSDSTSTLGADERDEQVELPLDVTGLYVVGLIVSDGKLASERDVVQIRVTGKPCSVDGDCDDDGQYCNGTELCVDGQCSLQMPPCDDQDPCTNDSCDEVLDQCSNMPVSDPPGDEGWDYDGTCSDGIDNDCDGALDGDDSACVTCSSDVMCDDGNDCTLDTCGGDGRCVSESQLDGTVCDDGFFVPRTTHAQGVNAWARRGIAAVFPTPATRACATSLPVPVP